MQNVTLRYDIHVKTIQDNISAAIVWLCFNFIFKPDKLQNGTDVFIQAGSRAGNGETFSNHVLIMV